MRVLLIKLTSMGDLIHALPAITDAQQAIPGISFDWVIDEAFHEVAEWHPATKKVIKSAHRRWKKDIIGSLKNGELISFYRELRGHPYDLVIDAQNNIKSAVITRLASNKAHGLDKQSVREMFAHLAYNQRYSIPKNMHAVSRLRLFFAKVFGYSLPSSKPCYQIDRQQLRPPTIDLPKKYVVFVHLASWHTKLWPEPNWQLLIKLALAAGYDVVLPSGSAEEEQRGQRLASTSNHIHALPRMSLSEVAWIMNQAEGAVSCDTGLCHMAAALDLPTVSFYGPTDVNLIGAMGQFQDHLVAREFHCAPCYQKRCTYSGSKSTESACMLAMQPELVWQRLQVQMSRLSTSELQQEN